MRRYRKHDLAARHLQAGPRATTTRRRTDLSQDELLRHFPTRDAILQPAMSWVAERLLASVGEAAQHAASPIAALEAVFMTHIDFVSRHPSVPRMLFGELQRPRTTLAKRMVQTMIYTYHEQLCPLLQAGKAQGELDAELDVEAAAILFIGTIQGLVLRSLLTGDIACIRHDAPQTFSLYRRGIESAR